MLEGWRLSIEFLPIRFRDQRLHVLEQRRTRKRSEDLEQGGRAAQIDSIIDGGTNALDRVGEKTEHIKPFCRDSFIPAMGNDLALMFGRDRPPPDAFQSRGIHGL